MTDSWKLPAPLATAEVRMDDGALIIIRRHGNPEGPRIILSHANGFSADLYYPFWSLLTDRFDVVIYDFRSHGWNPVSDLPAHNFWTFVNDNATISQAIDRHFGEKPKLGVYHSMSALTAILQEQNESAFAALVLFDPPIQLPRGTLEDMEIMGQKMSSATLRRRYRFDTREEFADSLRDKPAFARMQPGVADLFAQTVLRRSGNGVRYELCCPREHEARVWEYFYCWSVYSEIENLTCPVKVIGGDPTDPYSFIPSRELGAIIDIDYDFLPETTHLLMLEKPEECAALTLEFLENLEINP